MRKTRSVLWATYGYTNNGEMLKPLNIMLNLLNIVLNALNIMLMRSI